MDHLACWVLFSLAPLVSVSLWSANASTIQYCNCSHLPGGSRQVGALSSRILLVSKTPSCSPFTIIIGTVYSWLLNPPPVAPRIDRWDPGPPKYLLRNAVTITRLMACLARDLTRELCRRMSGMTGVVATCCGGLG
ncbi:hypothetical protein BXZ70DRAFT_439939 [Cristinia sonorae]|uniref:Secreted protein n=1 Tax=Cristinia sonorae TaxID=1940300 RepID=A0A8K0XMU1_9AGAR|nr:hypothetical protein BXZ70DRAFT_439939 [Cristinia sonorae]